MLEKSLAAMAMEGEDTVSYRRYALTVRELPGGWGVWIGDPAGPVADVVLHEQLAIEAWATPGEALQAAEEFVDELVGEESSY